MACVTGNGHTRSHTLWKTLERPDFVDRPHRGCCRSIRAYFVSLIEVRRRSPGTASRAVGPAWAVLADGVGQASWPVSRPMSPDLERFTACGILSGLLAA